MKKEIQFLHELNRVSLRVQTKSLPYVAAGHSPFSSEGMLVTSNPIRFDATSTSSVTNPLTFTPMDNNCLAMFFTTVVLPQPGMPITRIHDDISAALTWSIKYEY